MKLLLFILVFFVAIGSILFGLLMINNPQGGQFKLPIGLLDNSPFTSYEIPGMLLMAIVGGTNLFALFFNIQRYPGRYNWSIAGGLLICIWIISQMIVTRSVNWIPFTFFAAGVCIILLSIQLKGKAIF